MFNYRHLVSKCNVSLEEILFPYQQVSINFFTLLVLNCAVCIEQWHNMIFSPRWKFTISWYANLSIWIYLTNYNKIGGKLVIRSYKASWNFQTDTFDQHFSIKNTIDISGNIWKFKKTFHLTSSYFTIYQFNYVIKIL